MKRNNQGDTAAAGVATTEDAKANGHVNSELASADLSLVLASLQTMRDGDFSVRLPGAWTGLAGKIADTFNEIVSANQQMAEELKRVGQVVGKEGRTRERTRFDAFQRRLGRDGGFGQYARRGLVAPDDRSHACHRRRRSR